MTLRPQLATAVLAFAALFLFSASAARADNVQDFSYSGDITTSATPVPVTATFSFDETNYKIVGPSDFTTPLGTFSSTSTPIYDEFSCGNPISCYFTFEGTDFELILEVPLTSDYPVGYYGGGPITFGTITLLDLTVPVDGTIANVTPSTMPEPSALVLLATALASLAAFQLRRSARLRA